MSYPPTLHKTYTTGEILTAADLNSSLQDISTTNIPEDINDYSVNVAEMQSTADPYPASSESLATALSGELERLRYQMKEVLGEAQWYIDPDRTIASLASLLGASSTVALLPDGAVGAPSLSFASDPTTGLYSISSANLGIALSGSLLAQLSSTGLEMKGSHTLEVIAGSNSAPGLAFGSDTNTGLYSIGADNLGITVGGTLRLSLNTSAITSTLPFYAPNGSAGAAGLTFTNDVDTGIYLVSAGNLGLTVAGSLTAQLSSVGLEMKNGHTLEVVAGAVGAPGLGFATDTDTGLYLVSAGNLGFTVGGTLAIQLSSVGLEMKNGHNIEIIAGSGGAPGLAFAVDTNTGIWRPAADTIGLQAGGGEGIRVDNSSTARDTRLLVYDVDNGTINRVTVGTADSGDTGYKLLRIPN